jgi:hypothetical protein
MTLLRHRDGLTMAAGGFFFLVPDFNRRPGG